MQVWAAQAHHRRHVAQLLQRGSLAVTPPQPLVGLLQGGQPLPHKVCLSGQGKRVAAAAAAAVRTAVRCAVGRLAAVSSGVQAPLTSSGVCSSSISVSLSNSGDSTASGPGRAEKYGWNAEANAVSLARRCSKRRATSAVLPWPSSTLLFDGSCATTSPAANAWRARVPRGQPGHALPSTKWAVPPPWAVTQSRSA